MPCVASLRTDPPEGERAPTRRTSLAPSRFAGWRTSSDDREDDRLGQGGGGEAADGEHDRLDREGRPGDRVARERDRDRLLSARTGEDRAQLVESSRERDVDRRVEDQRVGDPRDRGARGGRRGEADHEGRVGGPAHEKGGRLPRRDGRRVGRALEAPAERPGGVAGGAGPAKTGRVRGELGRGRSGEGSERDGAAKEEVSHGRTDAPGRPRVYRPAPRGEALLPRGRVQRESPERATLPSRSASSAWRAR